MMRKAAYPAIGAVVVVTGAALGTLSACQSNTSAYVPPANQTSTSASPVKATASSAALLGQAVTDGPYRFVVDKVQCGITSLSTEFVTGTPSQGQFCVAVVAMTNTTNTPQSIPSTESMTDTNGNTYDTSTDGSAEVAGELVYLGSNYQPQSEVNPGSHYSDVYVFDVPSGVQASSVTLHGSFDSTGVTISALGGHPQPPASAPQQGNPAPAPATPPSSANSPAAPPPAATNANSPQDVVTAYFAAINAGDYQRAWALGGDNIEQGSYDSFVQGFADTSSDAVTIVSVSGDTVSVQLDATQTDGTHKYFSGTYTVQNGAIVSANIQ